MADRTGKARRIVTWVVVVVLVIAALVAAFAVFTVRRSFPQTDGTLQMPGLQAEVQVLRDELGIPQIYATNQHDLYMAQGYVHAQDRFWQMDVWRHIGAGRLSEMFGESQLDTDRFLRTLGWARVSAQEVAALDPESAAILKAYADGVNAYLAERGGASLSLEYSVLGLTNRDYKPEPWEALDSLVWVKVMAWDLSGNLDKEVERAVLLNTLTREQLDDLYPPYPSDHPVIVTGSSAQASTTVAPTASAPGTLAAAGDSDPSAVGPGATPPARATETLNARVAGLDELLAPLRESLGSNSWAVAGSRTATGKPLLANDTHLAVQMPSIWYQVGLHEGTGTAAGDAAAGPDGAGGASSEPRRVNVTGFSFPGAPGVVIGHNDRIAWGFTNVGADVQDLYIEKVNPENPDQYEVGGAWVDMETVTEEIQVAGVDPVTLTVRYTRHGPVVTDTYEPLADVGRPPDLAPDLPEQYVLALRWTALEPSNTLKAVRAMNLAQDFDEFREAARLWDVPSQNLLYADVDGHIGYQMPGKIPVRSGSATTPGATAGTAAAAEEAGNDGRYPVAGWTGENDWLGYVPFERLPYVLDPPEGYIVTANNAVTPGGLIDLTTPSPGSAAPLSFPAAQALITYDWHYGYRAQRIIDLIERADHLLEIADMRDIQADVYNLNAEQLRPLMLAADLDAATDLDAAARERVHAAQALLEDWDLYEAVDSPEAAFFETFWVHFLRDAFGDDLPADMGPRGGSIWFEVVRRLAAEPDSPWWDDTTTPAMEDLEAILVRAMDEAVDELSAAHGDDPAKWSWGDLHTVAFRNQTLGQSGIGVIEALFNRGPYPVAGSTSLVNAENWNAREPFEVISLPSLRMIVDLDNLNRSLALHTTGQSGHAYNRHYTDMIDRWRNVEHYGMFWEPGMVDKAARDRLTLTP